MQRDQTLVKEPGSSVCVISQTRISGVGYHFLLQGIFLTQGSSSHFLSLLAMESEFLTTSATWKALSSMKEM